jgi:hypothetical protein
MLLLSLIEEIDDAVLLKLLHPIRSHLDEILAPFAQAASIHDANFLILYLNRYEMHWCWLGTTSISPTNLIPSKSTTISTSVNSG